jgi:hypothetical protein
METGVSQFVPQLLRIHMLFAFQFPAPVFRALLINPSTDHITKQFDFFTQLKIHYRTSI